MKKFVLLFLPVFLLTAGVVFAQDESIEAVAITEEVEAEITAEDLGVKEPTLLPDSPFYFLKEWNRGIGNFFTFNPVKKAERRLAQANERLVEAQKLAEEEGNEEIAVLAMEKYEKAIEKTSERIEILREKEKDNEKFQNLVDKFAQDGLLQDRFINKIQKRLEKAPEEKRKRVEAVREKAIARWGKTLSDVDKEKIGERLEKAEQKIEKKGIKNFNNLEVLRRVEEKVPEEAKPALRKAQENTYKRIEAKRIESKKIEGNANSVRSVKKINTRNIKAEAAKAKPVSTTATKKEN